MTLLDFEAEARVFARDRAGQFVKALEGVIRNFEIEGRNVQFVRIDDAVVGEVAQRFHVGRRLIEIVHPFVEAGMCCCLDCRAAKVKIVHDLQGSRVSEEDAEAGVWHNAPVSRYRRTHVDAASERSKLCQVRERSAAHFVWTRWAVAVGNEVVDADSMIKHIRAKVRLQVCAREHCAKCIATCLVSLFAWSVLVQEIRAGELHGVSKVCERSMDVPALAEFASAVHAHVLVGALRRVACQPAVDPIDWWRFRCESLSENPATEMVSEKDVAGFAVEANEVVVSIGIAALLNHEPEVDRLSLAL